MVNEADETKISVEHDATRSIYAFVGWVGSYVFLVCYLGWAFLPARILHKMGITYYPSRFYAVAIPAYCLVVYILVVVGYIGFNMMNTPEPEDLITVRDEVPLALPAPPVYIKCGVKEGIPACGDIDPIALSKLLLKK